MCKEVSVWVFGRGKAWQKYEREIEVYVTNTLKQKNAKDSQDEKIFCYFWHLCMRDRNNKSPSLPRPARVFNVFWQKLHLNLPFLVLTLAPVSSMTHRISTSLWLFLHHQIWLAICDFVAASIKAQNSCSWLCVPSIHLPLFWSSGCKHTRINFSKINCCLFYSSAEILKNKPC